MAVYSVSRLVTYLRDLLEHDALVRDLWVRGEVANLSRPGSGHSYFSLRESGTTVRCVMFRNAFGSELLADGSAVIAHGRISMYEARGDLQLIVDILQPEGVGELQLKLEQLKRKLENEGLFDPSRKRPIPSFPRRVGVVTSPSGAVWRDIQTVIERRYPLVELLLAPTPVQGEDAVRGIVEAFDALGRVPDIDLLIVARGGGSLEDLRPFNDEAVARAIFSSHTPVISGVGHETDYTIADMAADRRAPTPSAAAEMAVPDRADLAARLRAAQESLTATASTGLQSRWDDLAHFHRRARRSKPDLDGLRLRIDDLLRRAAMHLSHDIQLKSERALGLSTRLDSLSPRDTLRRGYAVVRTQADPSAIVSDAAQVDRGDLVDITVARGGFGAEVTSPSIDGEEPKGDADIQVSEGSGNQRRAKAVSPSR